MNRQVLRRRVFLGGLLALHIANNVTIAVGVPYPVFVVFLMVVLSQSFLLAAWAGFGTKHVVIRIAQPAIILVILCLAPTLLAPGMSPVAVPGVLVLQSLYFCGSLGVYSFIHQRTGWRLVPWEPKRSTTPPETSGRLGLRQLFQVTAWSGVAFAIARRTSGFDGWPVSDWDGVIGLATYALAGCGIALALVPLMRCLLAERDGRLWATRAVTSVLAAVTIFMGVDDYASLPQSSRVWLALLQAAAFIASICANLWLVRLAGYRLVDTRAIAESSAPPALGSVSASDAAQ